MSETSMRLPSISGPGASAEAIDLHYSVSNAFYELWLDKETFSYTAASFDGRGEGDKTLGQAQIDKLDLLVGMSNASGARRVLDIGCGWGNLMRRLTDRHGVSSVVGLTLSRAQAESLTARAHRLHEARLESWRDHVPIDRYDAIFSVESIEAFAKPNLGSREKVEIYRSLFEKCHGWLTEDGTFTLQMIAYGNARPVDLDPFISTQIFPESDLPRLCEVVEASERLFEVISLRNDRLDYARTLRFWLDNLRARRAEGVALVGEEVFKRYDRYLRLCVLMFQEGGCDLHRVHFKRIARPRH